jgi:hypothetical protein
LNPTDFCIPKFFPSAHLVLTSIGP